ncbi:MAG: hypothetical protein D3903_06615 [Candidatus Electrothrix sp. GM3_4]|nr:hypothetical protein [Candidatus Electrothrix sp. GM3_4]
MIMIPISISSSNTTLLPLIGTICTGGHLTLDEQGRVKNLPIALAPDVSDGYYHNFSGSLLQETVKIADYGNQDIRPAFFTATGTGENGYASFLAVPPTVMAVTLDANLVKWEEKRYRVTDKDTFKNKIDTINNEKISNRYDMRDPIVFKRDGKYFMMIAGTALPGRKGQGLISILRPGNPHDLL